MLESAKSSSKAYLHTPLPMPHGYPYPAATHNPAFLDFVVWTCRKRLRNGATRAWFTSPQNRAHVAKTVTLQPTPPRAVPTSINCQQSSLGEGQDHSTIESKMRRRARRVATPGPRCPLTFAHHITPRALTQLVPKNGKQCQWGGRGKLVANGGPRKPLLPCLNECRGGARLLHIAPWNKGRPLLRNW